MRTQLLCTFAHRNDLNIIIDYVKTKYTVPEQRIFVFNHAEYPSRLFCTYNVEPSSIRGENTISIHRKKETNTLYTVNALNEVIRHQNNGVLDKTFQLQWGSYMNSFIMTDDEYSYRVIPLEMYQRINW